MSSTETFDITTPTRPTIVKDPAASLDYSFDWTPWLLDANDSISAFSLTPTAGLTVTTSVRVNGVITAWVAGGTPGKTAAITCHIATAGGRVDERTIYLQIRDR